MRPRPQKHSAFTLIELMISMAIGAIVLVASYLCLSACLASQKTIEPRAEVLQTGRVALALMAADLRSACSLSKACDFAGEHRMLDQTPADNLDFATHHYLPARPREGDYCQVSYFADPGARTSGLSLWRRRNPTVALDPLDGGAREEIAPGLRGLSLQYYDGFDWYDTWGDANPDKRLKYSSTSPPNLDGFPEAVRITLLLDPNPPKIKSGKAAGAELATPPSNGEKAPGPPLVFQTVVRLELADAPQPAAAAGADADASATSNSTRAATPDNGALNTP
jgi:prepilin-type N-terminal cleavage/methylation domain-containing protein